MHMHYSYYTHAYLYKYIIYKYILKSVVSAHYATAWALLLYGWALRPVDPDLLVLLYDSGEGLSFKSD